VLAVSIEKTSIMRANIIRKQICYFRMSLILPAIAVLGLAGCSTADPPAGHNSTAYIEIAPPAFNSEGRDFDRPWPFGPESTQPRVNDQQQDSFSNDAIDTIYQPPRSPGFNELAGG
jgi:hypothetical protein